MKYISLAGRETIDIPSYHRDDISFGNLDFLSPEFYQYWFAGKCNIEYKPRAFEFDVFIKNDDVRFCVIKIPVSRLKHTLPRIIAKRISDGYNVLVGLSQPDEGRWFEI